jgi:molybdate transport system ATP-binding protein
LLHTVAGIEPVRSGHVTLDGRVLDNGDVFVEPQDRRCVVVFQDLRLFPTMSVLENVAYGPRCHGAPRADAHARAREALARVGLAGFEGRRPDGLSGGERQKVAIARAVVTNPAVLLLDEPFAAVDADSRPGLREVLRNLLAGSEARTVIVSHDATDIRDLAGTVVRL